MCRRTLSPTEERHWLRLSTRRAAAKCGGNVKVTLAGLVSFVVTEAINLSSSSRVHNFRLTLFDDLAAKSSRQKQTVCRYSRTLTFGASIF